jgi:hypothetical protein
VRTLPIAALQMTLSLANAEATQSVYIRGGVVAPARLIPAGERQRSEPLTESQPAHANTQFVRGFADAESPLLSEHTNIEKPIS